MDKRMMDHADCPKGLAPAPGAKLPTWWHHYFAPSAVPAMPPAHYHPLYFSDLRFPVLVSPSARGVLKLPYGEGCKMSARGSFAIKFNGPATIVFWPDGSKTVAVCHEGYSAGAKIDPALGFCINYFKKHSGLSKNSRKKLFERIWGKTPFVTIANGGLIEMGEDPVRSFFEGFFRSHYGRTLEDQNAVLQRIEGAYKRYYRGKEES